MAVNGECDGERRQSSDYPGAAESGAHAASGPAGPGDHARSDTA